MIFSGSQLRRLLVAVTLFVTVIFIAFTPTTFWTFDGNNVRISAVDYSSLEPNTNNSGADSLLLASAVAEGTIGDVEMQNPFENITSNRKMEEMIFVRSAFRVSDTEIRFTLIKHYRNGQRVFYEYGGKKGRLEMYCNLPKCVDGFSPKCTVVGFIGIIQSSQIASVNEQSVVLRRADDSEMVTVPIIDVRPKPNTTYKHQLGVCLQPVYLHADFAAFAQFFEHWLDKGATKFYIYRHSYSPQVQAIIDLYIRTSNVSIELLDWSDLPEDKNGAQPTSFLYRLEVMMAIFDCMHRSRYTVKYMAQMDLDEVFIMTEQGKTVVQLMDELLAANPEMASATFVSRAAKLPSEFQTVHTPINIPLDKLENVDAELTYFTRPLYTKLIRLPERTFHAHIHVQFPAEKVGNTTREYKEYDVNRFRAYVLHLRRIRATFMNKRPKYKIQNIPETSRWQSALHSRLALSDMSGVQWDGSGLEVLSNVEKCRNQIERRKNKFCNSLYSCAEEVSPDHWFHAPNSWILL